MPDRRKLPDERQAITRKFKIATHKFYLTCGFYPDGALGEIFLKSEKSGSTLSGLLDGFSIAFSMALQHGTPLETLVKKYVNTRFEPAGFTGFEPIPVAHSPLDFVARYLAYRFLDAEGRQKIQAATQPLVTIPPEPPEISTPLEDEIERDPEAMPAPVLEPSVCLIQPAPVKAPEPLQLGGPSDGPVCTNCGSLLRPTGHCWTCPGCGETTGCG